MQISKKTIGTILIGLACLIGIVSIFCFFGASTKISESGVTVDGPTMFACMLGGTYNTIIGPLPVEADAGLTVLFVFEVLVILLALVLVVLALVKKLNTTTVICLSAILGLLMLSAAIMSFCTTSILDSKEGVKLGAGAVSYGILGIIGVISNATGIVVYKIAQ